MRPITSLAGAACAGLVVAACADPTGLPNAAPRPSASAVAASRISYPNSRKYRDAGFHPATGRSGSAVVSTRALLGRSGTTDLEVTTGTFDEGGAAPGTLASVQVKAFDHGGNLSFTSNHTALRGGGTASFAYTGLGRGTALQVQTVVRGIDGARSDVVTLSDAVRLRPDLVALRLAGPEKAVIGQPVNFEAFVMEALGDLGARASCVLYVDGAPADRADGIWVDAGGTVGCAMTYRFTTPGTHALALRVEGVNPGDFDDSNNSASASIEIAPPREFLAYGLYAADLFEDGWWRSVSPITWPDGSFEVWDQKYTEKGRSQYASMSGIVHDALDWPIHVSGTMATNGATIDEFAGDVWGEYVDWQQASCGSASSAGGGSAYVCVYSGSYLAGYTTVQYDWWGADVQYHTDNWVSSWDPTGELHQRYYTEDYTWAGPMVTFGPDFSAHVSMSGTGDAAPVTASATATLAPFSYDERYTSDPPCEAAPSTTPCYEHWLKGSGVNGFFYSGEWPPYVP